MSGESEAIQLMQARLSARDKRSREKCAEWLRELINAETVLTSGIPLHKPEGGHHG